METKVKQLLAYFRHSIVFDAILNENSNVLPMLVKRQLEKGRSVAVFSLPEINAELIDKIQKVIDEWEA